MEGSDDEEPVMGKQVLPIAHLPADFDGEPVDGLQYLFTVRYVSWSFKSQKLILKYIFKSRLPSVTPRNPRRQPIRG